MRLVRYLSSWLLVFVLSLGVFSTSLIVHAEDNLNTGIETLDITDDELASGDITIQYATRLNNGDWFPFNEPFTFTNNFTHTNSYEHNTKYFNNNIDVRDEVIIKYNNKDKPIVKKDETISFTISNLVDYWYIENVGNFINYMDVYYFRITAYSADGTPTSITPNYTIKQQGNNITIEITDYVALYDTYQLTLFWDYKLSSYHDMTGYFGKDYVCHRYGGFQSSIFSITYEDTKEGMLKSIIEWLTSIRDNIVNLPSKIASNIKGFFDNIVNKLQDVKNGILEGLTNLGNMLLDGIKGLFVPDAETLAAEKDKWDELLADRFGALYEVIALIDDYANTFHSEQQNTIRIPEIKVPIVDTEFVFGGWEVKIIPDGFTVLIEALKLIISISCTVLFVNGLRNRFERVIE